ncbi:hypothetical protein [Paracidovorax avenae]|uniref:hypothetical protein n=1 Tax=Paracidovorax avenae TaxID=80867 RepID=UPI0018651B6C|nr:hypothetical protein [Paracidovorax avenae]
MENDTAGVLDHRLVVAPNGTAVSAWLEDNSTAQTQSLYSVHARAYSPSTGWGAPVSFDGGTLSASRPEVAINANGDAILVWVRTDRGTSGNNGVASVRYSASTGTWDSAPANVLGTNDPALVSGFLNSHRVTLDNAGNAFYAFTAASVLDDPDGAWVKQYRNGAWGTAVRFRAGASSEAKEMSLAATPDGKSATALWKQFDNQGNKYRILASEYREGSGWSSGHEVDGNLASSYGPARIAIAANGDTTAVWEASTSGGSRTDIYAARLAGGTWGTPTIVGGDSIGRDGYLAGLCSDASGNAVMVTLPFSLGQVAATRFTVGGGWEAAVRIPPDDQAFTVPQASVACNTKGDAMVSWRAALGANNGYDLWARPYVAGSGWGTASQIVSLPSGPNGSRGLTLRQPLVGLDDSVRALALWTQDNQVPEGLDAPQSLWSAVFK